MGGGLGRWDFSHSDLPFSLSLPRVIPLTPVGPGLPGHQSTRPYTVFELEQVRQQSRKYGQRRESCAGLCRGVWRARAEAPPHAWDGE